MDKERKGMKVVILAVLTTLLVITVCGACYDLMEREKNWQPGMDRPDTRFIRVIICSVWLAELSLILDAGFHLFGRKKEKTAVLEHWITTVLACLVLVVVFGTKIVSGPNEYMMWRWPCFWVGFAVSPYLLLTWVTRMLCRFRRAHQERTGRKVLGSSVAVQIGKIAVIAAVVAVFMATVYVAIREYLRLENRTSTDDIFGTAFDTFFWCLFVIPVWVAELSLVWDVGYHLFAKTRDRACVISHWVTTVLASLVMLISFGVGYISTSMQGEGFGLAWAVTYISVYIHLGWIATPHLLLTWVTRIICWVGCRVGRKRTD